jgi:predicted amidohydrolase YtcJ
MSFRTKLLLIVLLTIFASVTVVAYGVTHYTQAAFEEMDKGSIEVGKLADFTVLSKDIMQISEPEILTTTCAMTVIGGEVVFEKNNRINSQRP